MNKEDRGGIIAIATLIAMGLYVASTVPGYLSDYVTTLSFSITFLAFSFLIGMFVSEKTAGYAIVAEIVILLILSYFKAVPDASLFAPFLRRGYRVFLAGYLAITAGTQVGKKYLLKYQLEQKYGVTLSAALVLIAHLIVFFVLSWIFV